MNLFPLDIFPLGSLSSSVITTVWVGVMVVAFFNLRLGWVLTGLVVPGYLVPLLIVRPGSAAVVVAEGLLTYLLVWFWSEVLSRRGLVSPLFGRDRFFALILCSVLVRLVCDTWVLPALAEALPMGLDLRYQLHSFGLIIVALIANQFWKTGLRRGLFPFAVTLGLTFVIVRYGLVEWTNFSISNLGYLYEDVSFSLLASPKSYIILITTAFIASRMNLHYGWEFNGILIPALLALQWYQPFKILTSIVEGGVILVLATLILRLPLFRRASVEGARKLVLFFNVSFAYKMILGYALLWWRPELKVTDYYGFGYLLATLMALKVHERGNALLLTRATLQTSLVAVVVASAVGFGLTLLPEVSLPRVGAVATAAPQPVRERQDLARILARHKVSFYERGPGRRYTPPLQQELDDFARGVRAALAYARSGNEADLERALPLLAAVGYRVDRVDGRYLYLSERAPGRGWGVYAIHLQAGNDLAVEVPAPLVERGSLEGAVQLFMNLPARALAVADPGFELLGGERAEPLLDPQTLFQVFHREAGRRNALQVRTYTPEVVRVLTGERRRAGEFALEEPPTTLWVHRQLPPGLDLPRLEALLGPFPLTWQRGPLQNVQREASIDGFAELFLRRSALRTLLARTVLAGREVALESHRQRIDGYLQSWLLEGKGRLAPRGSDAYRPPLQTELLYLDEEVLTPLLHLMAREYRDGDWSEAGLTELAALDGAAAVLGYRLVRYRHIGTERDYLLLAEIDGEGPRRFWGTYVLRLGPRSGFQVQIPRPLAELNSFEYGVSLFETLQADALLIGGAHPRANFDGRADLVAEQNKANVFNLVSQTLLREAGTSPGLVVQARALGFGRDQQLPGADALVAFADGTLRPEPGDDLRWQLWQKLEESGLRLRPVDGSLATTGYGVGMNPQALLLETARDQHFALVWVSPLVRRHFRQQDENYWQERQFEALGIARREADLAQLVAAAPWSGAPLPAGLRPALEDYLESQDILALSRALEAGSGVSLERVIDRDSRQAFALIQGSDRALRAVINLAPLDPGAQMRLSDRSQARAAAAAFIQRRGAWLWLEEAP